MVPVAVAANMNYIYMEVPSYGSGIPRLYKVFKFDMGPEFLPLKQTNVIQLPLRLGQKYPPVKRISAQLFHCKYNTDQQYCHYWVYNFEFFRPIITREEQTEVSHTYLINHEVLYIPYICHFFTRAEFLENKICTKKRPFFALNP